MGILSSTNSITRYKVDGEIAEPLLESVYDGLKNNIIRETDGDHLEKTVGWTSFDNPFAPAFEGSSFSIGTSFVFSLRIDKKTIPPKIKKKHYTIECSKRMADSGRDYLSQSEKKMINDHVENVLSLRIPSTPNIFDVVWNYEDSVVWFLTNLKSANEEFEILFSKSFKVSIIRLFPFTTVDFIKNISDGDKDAVSKLSSTSFN